MHDVVMESVEVLKGGIGESNGHASALFASLNDVKLLILGLEMRLEIDLGCWRPVYILYSIGSDPAFTKYPLDISIPAAKRPLLL